MLIRHLHTSRSPALLRVLQGNRSGGQAPALQGTLGTLPLAILPHQFRRGVCALRLGGELPLTYSLACGLCRTYATDLACLANCGPSALMPERNR